MANQFFLIGMSWTCMPALLGHIQNDIPMTKAQWGWVWGMVPVAIMLCGVLAGIAADRWGVRIVVGTGILLGSFFGITRGLSDDITTLAITMFFFGGAVSLAFINFPKTLGMWFTQDEYGLANGLSLLGFSLGGAITVMVSGAYISPLVGGWQRVLFLYGAIGLVLGILWWSLIREREPISAGHSGAGQHNIKEGIRKLLRVRQQWILVGLNTCQLAAFLGVVGFLPESLVRRGLSETSAHAVASVVLWGKIAGNFIFPVLSDRLGTRKTFLAILFPVMAVGIFLAGSFLGIPLILGCLITGLAIGGILPIIFLSPLETEEIGPSLAGSSMGMLFTIANLGAFIVQPLAGKLIDLSGSEATGFALFGLIMLAGLPLSLMLKETGLRAKAKKEIITLAPELEEI
jgi:MFS family permease